MIWLKYLQTHTHTHQPTNVKQFWNKKSFLFCFVPIQNLDWNFLYPVIVKKNLPLNYSMMMMMMFLIHQTIMMMMHSLTCCCVEIINSFGDSIWIFFSIGKKKKNTRTHTHTHTAQFRKCEEIFRNRSKRKKKIFAVALLLLLFLWIFFLKFCFKSISPSSSSSLLSNLVDAVMYTVCACMYVLVCLYSMFLRKRKKNIITSIHFIHSYRQPPQSFVRFLFLSLSLFLPLYLEPVGVMLCYATLFEKNAG